MILNPSSLARYPTASRFPTVRFPLKRSVYKYTSMGGSNFRQSLPKLFFTNLTLSNTQAKSSHSSPGFPLGNFFSAKSKSSSKSLPFSCSSECCSNRECNRAMFGRVCPFSMSFTMAMGLPTRLLIRISIDLKPHLWNLSGIVHVSQKNPAWIPRPRQVYGQLVQRTF